MYYDNNASESSDNYKYFPHTGSQEPLGAGGIVGIFFTVMLVVAGVGLIGYNYIQKKPKPITDGRNYSFDNALYFGSKLMYNSTDHFTYFSFKMNGTRFLF